MTSLGPFHPAVRTWFAERLGEPTPPQIQGWPRIREGLNTLMHEVGVTPQQTVMIGDSKVDVETARNAGTWSIGCTFGLAPESLTAVPPDILVDSPLGWTAALTPSKTVAR